MGQLIGEFPDLRWIIDGLVASRGGSLWSAQLCPKTQRLQLSVTPAFHEMDYELRHFFPELDEFTVELIVRQLNARLGWNEQARCALEQRVAERRLLPSPTVGYSGVA